MRLTVAPGQWPGDDLETTMRMVDWAREHGASGVWMSEVNGYDAVGLAALAARSAPELEVTVGPVVAGVRSPAQSAMALATIAAVSSMPPRIALGAGNPRIVSAWHGRDVDRAPRTMIDHVLGLRRVLAGEHSAGAASDGFRLSVGPPAGSTVAVAALGPRMLEVAGGYADAVVVNLLSPSAVGAVVDRVTAAALERRRAAPPVVAWMMVGDTAVSGPRITKFLRPYLSAAGYEDVLATAGITARTTAAEALGLLTGLGPPEVAVERALEYVNAGVAEVVAVGSTRDPAAGRSVAALARVAAPDPPVHATTIEGVR